MAEIAIGDDPSLSVFPILKHTHNASTQCDSAAAAETYMYIDFYEKSPRPVHQEEVNSR